MKIATFFKRHSHLQYWDSRNTLSTVNCSSLAMAKAIIKKSAIEQKLVSSLL